MVDLVVRRTGDFSSEELRVLLGFLDAAFDGLFSDDDWRHTIGGLHVLALGRGVIASHAALVPRSLVVGQRSLSAGYVEGVATRHDGRRRGHASRTMRTAGDIIARDYDLGALSTGSPEFYARLGWESWRGPTYVNAPDGRRRTADEDDGVMVLRTFGSGEIDLTAELTCDWRSGDVW
ncbi:MAG: GNAT family N-acetyltransferase [Actinomycetota bacterium]|nr:GNAT family N-acetyltransferase [Actinomycetota bacterium]